MTCHYKKNTNSKSNSRPKPERLPELLKQMQHHQQQEQQQEQQMDPVIAVASFSDTDSDEGEFVTVSLGVNNADNSATSF
jgi:hypothetical protein